MKTQVESKLAQKLVNNWWDTWHRFADEDDLAPEEIQNLIDAVADQDNLKFDIMSGMWK